MSLTVTVTVVVVVVVVVVVIVVVVDVIVLFECSLQNFDFQALEEAAGYDGGFTARSTTVR